MSADRLQIVTIPFLLVTIISFLLVFYWQYKRLDNETNRLVIIATRLALFLPFYGILIYISLAIPVLYLALEVPTAIIEGYSFYTFFVLMVVNLGGPNETVNYLNASNKPLLFYCCCPSDKKQFYKNACWNVFHFLFSRVVVVLLSVICSYAALANGNKIAKLLSVIFALVALIQLCYGVASVVNLYEDVYGNLKNLNGVLKVFLLKISVGLITLQGIVVECLVEFGGNPYDSNSEYSAADRLQRNFCALILIEFTVMAGVYLWAFGAPVTVPSTPYAKYIAVKGNIQRNDKPTAGWFLCEVLRFSDVFGTLALEEDSSILKLGEHLMSNDGV